MKFIYGNVSDELPLTEGRKLNELYIFDRKTTIKYIRNMVEKVFKFIKENRIFDSGDSVILGVSGGADSICMLTVLCKLKHRLNLKLYVVHVNHGIRGGDALEDENFVKRKISLFFHTILMCLK